jgi:hypothetical protein
MSARAAGRHYIIGLMLSAIITKIKEKEYKIIVKCWENYKFLQGSLSSGFPFSPYSPFTISEWSDLQNDQALHILFFAGG